VRIISRIDGFGDSKRLLFKNKPLKERQGKMSKEKTVVQNKATPIESIVPEADSVCRDVAERVFEKVMNWHPLEKAADIAAGLIIKEMENADFFEEKYSLTERQANFIRDRIKATMFDGGRAAVAEIKDFDKKHEDYVGSVVIRELITIPEKTMQEIGKSINRGALLAMTVLEASATNEDYDKIVMRKSKDTGDITIPTRGVFISTNCIERIKNDINFLGSSDVTVEVQ